MFTRSRRWASSDWSDNEQKSLFLGNPVSDPSKFYGREREIRQITDRLFSSAFESTSVVGERRIGKTSLLKYLANTEVAESLGLTPDEYVMVYVDFQGSVNITPPLLEPHPARSCPKTRGRGTCYHGKRIAAAR